MEASKTNLKIAETQFNRIQTLQEEGLKAVKDVEEKRLKLQETQAKFISQENKYLASQNEVINARLELSRTNAAFTDKISKAQSDMFTATDLAVLIHKHKLLNLKTHIVIIKSVIVYYMSLHHKMDL